MLTGEKIMPRYKADIFIPCSRDHADNVPVRVSDLRTNLDRPAPREKSITLRTSDVS